MSFPVPTGVPTSITLPELALLQEYAARAGTVLEIGTYYGYSAIGMALAGAQVTTVDPHDQGPAGESDTWDQFLRNCERHGFTYASVAGDEDAVRIRETAIIAFRRPIESIDPGVHPFGMAFIDGDHSAPVRDAELAISHLREPAYLAFHDMTPRWPDVWRSPFELGERGHVLRLVAVVESLYICQVVPQSGGSASSS